MATKLLPTIVFGLSMGIVGCGDSTPATSGAGGSTSASGGASGGVSGGSGGTVATGGKASGGSTGGASTATGGSASGGVASGGTASGGVASGGTASGGVASGGTASGGTSSGGKASGGTASGGSTGGGGAASGGSSGTGGSGSGGSTGGGSAPVLSKGCNNAQGKATMTTGGASVDKGLPTSTKLKIRDREYIIDIPADYDPTHPYRLIFSWHQAYGSATGNANGQYPANNGPNFDAKNYAYFGLHREATTAKDPAIFVAPQGIGNFPWDYNRDVVIFDDLLALVATNLCIDESRVFTTGFSFGAMMSYALSIGRASKLRGAVTMAAANYNFTQPTNTKTPIAYFGITGMSDGTCPWGDNSRGGKACVLQHAQDNGCKIPTDITTAKGGSKNHVCLDFEGCKAGYPVKVCTFDGNHTPSSISDGANGGDDGLKAFVPPLAWKFISQL